MIKTPIVYWAQRKRTLLLRVTVHNVDGGSKNTRCEVVDEGEDSVFKFNAEDVHGDEFKLDIVLRSKVQPGPLKYEIVLSDFFITMDKIVDESNPDTLRYWDGFWKGKKPRFVNMDGERWIEEDEEDKQRSGGDMDSLPMDFGDYNMDDFKGSGSEGEDEDLMGDGEKVGDEAEEKNEDECSSEV